MAKQQNNKTAKQPNNQRRNDVAEQQLLQQQKKIHKRILSTAINTHPFLFLYFFRIGKEGTGRRALGHLLSPDVLCFTLEVSFYASHRDGVGLVPYTRVGYVELGRCTYTRHLMLLLSLLSLSSAECLHAQGRSSILNFLNLYYYGGPYPIGTKTHVFRYFYYQIFGPIYRGPP